LDDFARTKFQIDIPDCTAFTLMRGIQLFTAILKILNPIATKSTIQKHY